MESGHSKHPTGREIKGLERKEVRSHRIISLQARPQNDFHAERLFDQLMNANYTATELAAKLEI